MHLTIRKYSGVTNRDEAIRRVEEGLLPDLRRKEGFVAYYGVEFDDGDLGSVSVFESQETSDRATSETVDWVTSNLGEMLPNAPDITKGTVILTADSKAISKTA